MQKVEHEYNITNFSPKSNDIKIFSVCFIERMCAVRTHSFVQKPSVTSQIKLKHMTDKQDRQTNKKTTFLATLVVVIEPSYRD